MKIRSKHPIAIQSQKWISTAFINLLITEEYEQITITQIAYAAGVDRSTFYRNFSSKEDIIISITEQIRNEYIEEIENLEQMNLYTITKVYFDLWSTYTPLLNSVKNNNLLGITMESTTAMFFDIYNYFSKQEGVNLPYTIDFISGGLVNILDNWSKNGAKKTPEEMALLVVNIIERNFFL